MPRIGIGGGLFAQDDWGGGGGASNPAIALKLIGGQWFVDDANVSTPSGYFVFSGPNLVIDTSAGAGLPIAESGGHILVGT